MSISTASSHAKIKTCLWYDRNAEEAVTFYVNLFNNAPNSEKHPKARIAEKTHYMKEALPPSEGCAPAEAGNLLTIDFSLAGHEFMGLNGGPLFQFTPATSFMIECEDQQEIDHFYDGFSEGVAERQLNCGWVQDRFGLSWQVVPRFIRETVEDGDRTRYKRIHIWLMKALPKKLILKDILAAASGEGDE